MPLPAFLVVAFVVLVIAGNRQRAAAGARWPGFLAVTLAIALLTCAPLGVVARFRGAERERQVVLQGDEGQRHERAVRG